MSAAAAAASSRDSKWFRILFSLLILNLAAIVKSSQEANLNGENAKVEIFNLSLPRLTNDYLGTFNVDLTLLKISHGKIEKIEPNAFVGLKHLNVLDLSDSEINEKIDPQTFSRLPSLEVLILRNVGLRAIDLDLDNVQQLILSQNKIENFNEGGIRGGNVNYLDLSDNKMKRIDNSFGALDKLSTIDISKNGIDDVTSDAFKRNRNLIAILASENQIESTEGFRISRLKTLDLFSNKITELKSDSFEKMSSLEELVLAFNNIKTVEDPFGELIELKYLNLAWNFIEGIPSNLFRNNLYLTHLSLSGNNIESLNRFDNVLEHLENLDLSHNRINFIDGEFFASTPNLNRLNLNFNKLKSISDSLRPLNALKILNLAYNELVLTGNEFSKNHELTRLNLSSNQFLDVGLNSFENNTRLTWLDLSGNAISKFCERDGNGSKMLKKIDLNGNRLKDLDCLMEKKFDSVCLIDIRNNPLTCGRNLDELIFTLAARKTSPFNRLRDFQSDVVQDQCETLSSKQSFNLWNSIKRDLCPEGNDFHVKSAAWVSTHGENEDEDDEEVDEDVEDEDEDEDDDDDEEEIQNSPKNSLAENYEEKWPGIASMDSSDATKENLTLKGNGRESQSEKMSLKRIDEDSIVQNESEEEEELVRSHYNWYTIALALIGISLTLTCFNLAVFLYFRLRIRRRSNLTNVQKYTFLKNEVYRNTTEPSIVTQSNDSIWFPDKKSVNKLLHYGKINEFFQNFGGSKMKDGDTESTKNILVHSLPISRNSNC